MEKTNKKVKGKVYIDLYSFDDDTLRCGMHVFQLYSRSPASSIALTHPTRVSECESRSSPLESEIPAYTLYIITYITYTNISHYLKSQFRIDEDDYDDLCRQRRCTMMLMIAAQSSVVRREGYEEEDETNGLTFRQRLNLEGRQRRDRRIPRAALLDPSASPWAKLYVSRSEQALITVTGFDHQLLRISEEK
jgi:hypothetical protein